MLTITPVHAFNDNYLWLFHEDGCKKAYIVDPGDATPVIAALNSQGLELAGILITHHHADHTGGINTLLTLASVPVYGPRSSRISQITHPVGEGDKVTLAGCELRVLEVPGHTLEHIAYASTTIATPNGHVLFCGDTLFAGGCGRMFEGTPPVMQNSLARLAALPADTQVYCAHEYTLSNLRFAAAVMPDAQALKIRIANATKTREDGLPTVPSSLALELETNPFLRCEHAEVIAAARKHAQHEPENAAEVFGILRRWKDAF